MKFCSILFCIILSSCITGKVAVKTGILEIRFGYGGGFTGKVNTYLLSADGHLSGQEKDNSISKKVDNKTTLAIFLNAKEIELVLLFEPDNIYSFIEIKTKEKSNRIVWSFGSTKVSSNVVQLYGKLISLTK